MGWKRGRALRPDTAEKAQAEDQAVGGQGGGEVLRHARPLFKTLLNEMAPVGHDLLIGLVAAIVIRDRQEAEQDGQNEPGRQEAAEDGGQRTGDVSEGLGKRCGQDEGRDEGQQDAGPRGRKVRDDEITFVGHAPEVSRNRPSVA